MARDQDESCQLSAKMREQLEVCFKDNKPMQLGQQVMSLSGNLCVSAERKVRQP